MLDLVQEYSSFPTRVPGIEIYPSQTTKPTIVSSLSTPTLISSTSNPCTTLDPHWRNRLAWCPHPLPPPFPPVAPPHHLPRARRHPKRRLRPRLEIPPNTASPPSHPGLASHLPSREILREPSGSFRRSLFVVSGERNLPHPRRLGRQLPYHPPLLHQRSHPGSPQSHFSRPLFT